MKTFVEVSAQIVVELVNDEPVAVRTTDRDFDFAVDQAAEYLGYPLSEVGRWELINTNYPKSRDCKVWRASVWRVS